MFYVIHMLLGGVIGLHIHSITLIVLIAFMSHFLIDSIPHWGLGFDKKNFKKNYEVNFNRKLILIGVVDGILAIFLLIFMYDKFSSTRLVVGCMASIFPDLLSAGYLTKLRHKKRYKKFLEFHNNIQRDAGIFFGILTQIIIALVILDVLF